MPEISMTCARMRMNTRHGHRSLCTLGYHYYWSSSLVRISALVDRLGLPVICGACDCFTLTPPPLCPLLARRAPGLRTSPSLGFKGRV